MSTALTSALVEEIEAGNLELPVLNQTVVQLLALTSEADYDPLEVADLIETDCTLAAHILQIANSVAFAPEVPIENIRNAVSRLGASTISEIGIALMVKERIFKGTGVHKDLIQELWVHSSIAAIYAQRIGQLRRTDCGSAMLCGLLHDIGKPVLVQMCLEVEPMLGQVFDRMTIEAVIETLHVQVGTMLVQEWGLPRSIEVAVQKHHDYEEVVDHGDAAMVAQLANELAHWAVEPESRRGQNLRDLKVVGALELNRSELGGLFADRERVIEIANTFG